MGVTKLGPLSRSELFPPLSTVPYYHTKPLAFTKSVVIDVLKSGPETIQDALLNPESVAVIGAPRFEGKVGHAVLKNIIDGGYRGRVYPVNPQADNILGLKCYRGYRL